VTAVADGQRAERGAFCPCGAWRGELGSEPTPALFIEHLVSIFDEVWRVMRKDATLWVNLGDSYSGSGKGPTGHNGIGDQGERQGFTGGRGKTSMKVTCGGPSAVANAQQRSLRVQGIPAKNLLLIPQRFAIAMQDKGWIVRSEIVWAKTSAMPESVRDRPTSAWEPIWMFSKQARYFYDGEAVRQPRMEPGRPTDGFRTGGAYVEQRGSQDNGVRNVAYASNGDTPTSANLRNVWTLGPAPFADAHFATFPPEIPRRCILAGTSEKGACPACGAPWVRVVEREANPAGILGVGNGRHVHDFNPSAKGAHVDAVARSIGWQPSCSCPPADPVPCVVLDPFLGSGTTALVADRLGRDAIGIELNETYARMAEKRISEDAGPMLADVAVEMPHQASLFGEVAG
jgi:DNA modification methylase